MKILSESLEHTLVKFVGQLFLTQPFVLTKTTYVRVPLRKSEITALINFPADCLGKTPYKFFLATNFSGINLHAHIRMCR